METPKSKCKNCGKMTDISESKVYIEMKTKFQVATEQIDIYRESIQKILRQRTGQLNAMHIMIKRLFELMTKEQRERAFKLSQSLRDEFKRIKKMK